MINPKEDRIKISSPTALSWFVGSMLKHFIGEDFEARLILADSLEAVAIEFCGELDECAFTTMIGLLRDESLTTKEILKEMDDRELVVDDGCTEGLEMRMMMYAFYNLGLDKDWTVVAELDFMQLRRPAYMEKQPNAILYAVRKQQ